MKNLAGVNKVYMAQSLKNSHGLLSHNVAPLSLPAPSFPSPTYDICLATGPIAFTLSNIRHRVSLKLTRENYLLWRFQFLPVLYSQHLFGIVDGTVPCPTRSLPDGSPHPKFPDWFKVEQTIQSWLLLPWLQSPLLRFLAYPVPVLSGPNMSILLRLGLIPVSCNFASNSKPFAEAPCLCQIILTR